MKDYFSWLNVVPGEGKVLLTIIKLLTFASLGLVGGAVALGYIYLVFQSYGLLLLLPIAWSYWYYRKYGMSDE